MLDANCGELYNRVTVYFEQSPSILHSEVVVEESPVLSTEAAIRSLQHFSHRNPCSEMNVRVEKDTRSLIFPLWGLCWGFKGHRIPTSF